MVFTEVQYILHNNPDTWEAFSDFVDDDGRFINDGVKVYSALKAHKTIDVGGTVEIIVPYHAVMEWKVTKTEGEYTKPEDDFCKSACEPIGGITLLDGTYTFEEVADIGAYSSTLAKCYDANSVTIMVDGVKTVLPRTSDPTWYGALNDDAPVFDFYPAAVNISRDGGGTTIAVYLPTAGSHTVVVIAPDGSEVECKG